MANVKPGQRAIVINDSNVENIGIICRVRQRAPREVERRCGNELMWDVLSEMRPFAGFCTNCLQYHIEPEAWIADRCLKPLSDLDLGDDDETLQAPPERVEVLQ
jgi:hypothetical protein